MKVIGRKVVAEFAKRHPDSRTPLDDWHRIVKSARWQSLVDLNAIFPRADYVDPYMVFDIGGNKYRLIAVVHYKAQLVHVMHVLTHTEYDRGGWKK